MSGVVEPCALQRFEPLAESLVICVTGEDDAVSFLVFFFVFDDEAVSRSVEAFLNGELATVGFGAGTQGSICASNPYSLRPCIFGRAIALVRFFGAT